jgi:hypothetical protein
MNETIHGISCQITTNLRLIIGMRANYTTELPPLVGEGSANFCG